MPRSAKDFSWAVPVLAAVLAACSSTPAPVVQGSKDGKAVVRPGDTLYKIARRHGVGLRALIDANGAAPPYVIRPGQLLTLPGEPARPARTAGGGRWDGGSARGSDGTKTAALPPREERRPPAPTPPKAGGNRFIWPLKGPVISRYGRIGKGLYNDGINIGAPRGSPVRAVGGGVVAYVGNEIPGFGNLLLIRHDGVWVSAYAHNETTLVRQGQNVRQGQVVARVGASGNVTAPQLHFELRKRNEPVDPERYLRESIASGPSAFQESLVPVLPARCCTNCQATRPERAPRVIDHSVASAWRTERSTPIPKCSA